MTNPEDHKYFVPEDATIRSVVGGVTSNIPVFPLAERIAATIWRNPNPEDTRFMAYTLAAIDMSDVNRLGAYTPAMGKRVVSGVDNFSDYFPDGNYPVFSKNNPTSQTVFHDENIPPEPSEAPKS